MSPVEICHHHDQEQASWFAQTVHVQGNPNVQEILELQVLTCRLYALYMSEAHFLDRQCLQSSHTVDIVMTTF